MVVPCAKPVKRVYGAFFIFCREKRKIKQPDKFTLSKNEAEVASANGFTKKKPATKRGFEKAL
jgi:hypothetical protein